MARGSCLNQHREIAVSIRPTTMSTILSLSRSFSFSRSAIYPARPRSHAGVSFCALNRSRRPKRAARHSHVSEQVFTRIISASWMDTAGAYPHRQVPMQQLHCQLHSSDSHMFLYVVCFWHNRGKGRNLRFGMCELRYAK